MSSEELIMVALRFLQLFRQDAGLHDDFTYVIDYDSIDEFDNEMADGHLFFFTNEEIDRLCEGIASGEIYIVHADELDGG